MNVFRLTRKWRFINTVVPLIIAALIIAGSISKISEHNAYIVRIQIENLEKARLELEIEQTLRLDYREFLTRKLEPIPKIIHQIYRNVSIPSAYTDYIKSWVEKNPDYEYWFWDNDSGRQLVASQYSEFLPTYDGYCHDLFRSDAMRYFILNAYGGIYIDMDYESLKSLGDLLDGRYLHVVQEYGPQAEVLYNTDTMILNAWMAAVPYHPFMNFLINNLPLRAQCPFEEILKSTGPVFLHDMKNKYDNITKCGNDTTGSINVLPYHLMVPEWDTSPKTRNHIRSTCRRLSRLTAVQRRACVHFRSMGFTSTVIRSDAYATHKFLHIGNLASKYEDKSGYSSIVEIVPKVVFPMERSIDAIRKDVEQQQDKLEKDNAKQSRK